MQKIIAVSAAHVFLALTTPRQSEIPAAIAHFHHRDATMLNWHDDVCPYCGEPLQLCIDPSAGDQSYVEDCAVCCRPIEVRVEWDEGTLQSVSLRRDDE